MADRQSSEPHPLHVSLRKWAGFFRDNLTDEVTRITLSAILGTSPIVDNVSTWLLAGSGATAALMISSMDRLIPILRPGRFAAAVLLLAVSILFGLAQKLLALYVHIFIAMDLKLRKLAGPVLNERDKEEEELEDAAGKAGIEIDTEIDMKRLLDELLKVSPWYAKYMVKRSFESGFSDPLEGYRRAVRVYNRQSAYAALQLISVLAFVVVTALGIRIG